MVATRYCFLFCLISLGFIGTVDGQSCSNCGSQPKVIQFDFDIKVPEPNKNDGTENLWPQWKQLFTLAGSVEARLLEKNAGCVRFTMPPSVDTGGIQQITTAGETFTNLPSNPTIATNLSPYGDYLLTG
ncbi:MAG: hypothetical protein ACJ749_14930, partial [Flavisolibacter sp.]